MFGLTVWGHRPHGTKVGASCPHCPSRFQAYCIKHIIAYMRLLLASIATGQLRKCASIQQLSLLSRPRFLELGEGAQIPYEPPPPAKKLEGLSPR